MEIVTKSHTEVKQNTVNKTELLKAVSRLNTAFRTGSTAFDVIDDIRKFPRPIVVDFNNVLVNKRAPLVLNPDAPAFLKELRQIGNVFIVTSALNWEGIQEYLQTQSLWSDDIVLMTGSTYENISEQQKRDKIARGYNKDLLVNTRGTAWQYEEGERIQMRATKLLAPIFAKPFKVPIIDDSPIEAHFNPGMYGINVKAWETTDSSIAREIYERKNHDKLSLSEASGMVHDYYDTLRYIA